jgi:hypothetical protein
MPATGVSNNLYYAELEKTLYRWNGSTYVDCFAASPAQTLFFPNLAGFPVS